MNKIWLIGILYFVSLITLIKGLGAPGEKTWMYEIKSVTSETSNAEVFDTTLKCERKSRGVYVISGELIMNIDIVEGDTNLVAAKSYRSINSDGNFKSLPFQMSPTHWHKVLNTYYKDVIMKTLADCSDLPNFEGDFEPPFERKTYTLNQCQFSQDGLPNHLDTGTYKLDIIGSGAVDWVIEVIAEIMPNV